MLGTILALAGVAALDPLNGAHYMAWGESQAVFIYSVPWEEPGATNPYVRAMTDGIDEALEPPGREREVCIRSEHDSPGELAISSDRFRTVIIPHGTALLTRCATVTIYNWPQERPGRIFVQEGTYWGQNGQTETTVDGWIRNVSVRRDE